MPTVTEGLAEVRELFERTHWTQGHYKGFADGGKVTYCAVGGLRQIFTGDAYCDDPMLLVEVESYRLTVRTLVVRLAERGFARAQRAIDLRLDELDDAADVESSSLALDEFEGVLVEWNDDEDRTLADVLDLLNAAQAVQAERRV